MQATICLLLKRETKKTLKFLLLFFSFVHLKPINHESEKCLSLPRKKRNVSKMLAGWLAVAPDKRRRRNFCSSGKSSILSTSAAYPAKKKLDEPPKELSDLYSRVPISLRAEAARMKSCQYFSLRL